MYSNIRCYNKKKKTINLPYHWSFNINLQIIISFSSNMHYFQKDIKSWISLVAMLNILLVLSVYQEEKFVTEEKIVTGYSRLSYISNLEIVHRNATPFAIICVNIWKNKICYMKKFSTPVITRISILWKKTNKKCHQKRAYFPSSSIYIYQW